MKTLAPNERIPHGNHPEIRKGSKGFAVSNTIAERGLRAINRTGKAENVQGGMGKVATVAIGHGGY